MATSAAGLVGQPAGQDFCYAPGERNPSDRQHASHRGNKLRLVRWAHYPRTAGPIPEWCSAACRHRACGQARARRIRTQHERGHRTSGRCPGRATARSHATQLEWARLLRELATQLDQGAMYDRHLPPSQSPSGRYSSPSGEGPAMRRRDVTPTRGGGAPIRLWTVAAQLSPQPPVKAERWANCCVLARTQPPPPSSSNSACAIPRPATSWAVADWLRLPPALTVKHRAPRQRRIPGRTAWRRFSARQGSCYSAGRERLQSRC